MRGYHGLDASVHAADEAMMREGGEEEESYAADVSVLGPMKSGRAAHGGGDSPPPEPITRRESVSDRRRESVGLVQQRRVSAAPRVSVSSKGGGGGGGGGGGTNFAERGVWPGWLEEHAGSALADWLPRDVLTFKTLAKVGQGTFSRVYKASDLNEGGEPCALKEIRLERADKDTLSLVAREIMMLRKLGDHDNVVNLRAIAVDSNDAAAIYLVFEYLPHDLAGLMSSRASRMREKKKGGGGGGGDDDDDGGDVAAGRVLSPGEVKHVAKQLLKALAHCHAAGGMHRDVKCSNLLVDDTGDVKLADFGLSRTPRDAEPLTNHVVTLWYRPPELLLGARRYDSKVDVWSAGCVLAELLWGEPILPGRTEVEQLHLIFKLVGSEGSARLAEKCKGFAPTSKVKEYPRARGSVRRADGAVRRERAGSRLEAAVFGPGRPTDRGGGGAAPVLLREDGAEGDGVGSRGRERLARVHAAQVQVARGGERVRDRGVAFHERRRRRRGERRHVYHAGRARRRLREEPADEPRRRLRARSRSRRENQQLRRAADDAEVVGVDDRGGADSVTSARARRTAPARAYYLLIIYD